MDPSLIGQTESKVVVYLNEAEDRKERVGLWIALRLDTLRVKLLFT